MSNFNKIRIAFILIQAVIILAAIIENLKFSTAVAICSLIAVTYFLVSNEIKNLEELEEIEVEDEYN